MRSWTCALEGGLTVGGVRYVGSPFEQVTCLWVPSSRYRICTTRTRYAYPLLQSRCLCVFHYIALVNAPHVSLSLSLSYFFHFYTSSDLRFSLFLSLPFLHVHFARCSSHTHTHMHTIPPLFCSSPGPRSYTHLSPLRFCELQRALYPRETKNTRYRYQLCTRIYALARIYVVLVSTSYVGKYCYCDITRREDARWERIVYTIRELKISDII